MKAMKRFLAMVLCAAMLVSLLPLAALAHNDTSIPIDVQVDVFDVSANEFHKNVAHFTVQRQEHGVQSEWVQLPTLSNLVSGKEMGRVQKITGNWFPTSYTNAWEGANVQFSNNNSKGRVTYYVSYYGERTDGTNPDRGGGSDGNKTEPPMVDDPNLQGNPWTETITYHANFPGGPELEYKVTYTINYKFNLYNAEHIIKKYSDCGFTVPDGWTLANPVWNTRADGKGKTYSENDSFTFWRDPAQRTVTDLYAQYNPKVDQMEDLFGKVTYMNGSEKFQEAQYGLDPEGKESTEIPVTADAPTNAPTTTAALKSDEEQNVEPTAGEEKTFQGWSENSSATSVDHVAGDSLYLTKDNNNITLYAVWAAAPTGPVTPDATNVQGNVVVQDKNSVHVAKTFGLEDGCFTAGTPTEANGTTTCDVTLDAAKYAEKYSAETDIVVPHELAEGQEDVTVTLVWNDTESKWQPQAQTTADSDPTLATINVACAPITLTAADMTTYMGGTGYAGVGAESGLPTPGYTLTLPDWLTADSYFGADAVKEDLSQSITIVDSTDAENPDKAWTLTGYADGTESTTTAGDDARFVYQLIANTPVSVAFKDGEQTVTNDSFGPSADKLFTQYDMAVSANADNLRAKVTTQDGKTIVLPVAFANGKLTVRGTSDATTTPVANDTQSITTDFAAVASGADTTYHLGDSNIAVNAQNVQLLSDALLENKQPMEEYLKAQNLANDSAKVQYEYLDLVDGTNGNALVKADKALDVYWKLPADAETDKDVTLVHFNDLDRNANGAATITNADVYATNASGNQKQLEKVTVGDNTYLKFTVDSFSPFALIYTAKGGNQGGGEGGGGTVVPPSTTNYRLHYESNGGTTYKDEWYKRGTVVDLDKTPSHEGYSFTGWYSDEALTDKIDSVKMNRNKTVYAGWQESTVPPDLNGDDHDAYVFGYEDGSVRPMRNVTRAEVASIFFRLLKDEVRDDNLTTTSAFTDVSADDWYGTSVATMAKMGIVKGRTENTFDPNAPITRAEFAAIAARFDESDIDVTKTFDDIDGHWAKDAIERAASLGWIAGYEDGSFRPDNRITRAESVAMINRVLQRLPETEDDLLEGMTEWPDNQPGSWYYLAMQEATNGHEYEMKEDGVHEHWTALKDLEAND